MQLPAANKSTARLTRLVKRKKVDTLKKLPLLLKTLSSQLQTAFSLTEVFTHLFSPCQPPSDQQTRLGPGGVFSPSCSH